MVCGVQKCHGALRIGEIAAPNAIERIGQRHLYDFDDLILFVTCRNGFEFERCEQMDHLIGKSGCRKNPTELFQASGSAPRLFFELARRAALGRVPRIELQ